MSADAGPFELPDRWVHADRPPTWEDLGAGPVAVVLWRLDEWPSLERLHAVDRAARESESDATVLGIHLSGGRPVWRDERVRDVLLARGTWAPSAIVTEAPDPLGGPPGEVAVVADGTVQAALGPGEELEAVVSELDSRASEGEGWRPRGAAPGPWPLAFPSDVAVSGSRLAVADTGHNRVVLARPGGEVTHLVGDGVPGHRDGDLEAARFEAPRGVCWIEDELWVADTANDALRLVDLGAQEVTTPARTPEGSLPAAVSPAGGDELVVALAGLGDLARGRETVDPIGDLEALGTPVDVSRTEEGLLVADLAGPAIRRLEGDSLETVHEGEPLVEPTGVLETPGRRLAADPGAPGLLDLSGSPESARELVGPDSGIEAPSAADAEAGGLVVADGGGHHVWRLETDGDPSPERVRFIEPPLSVIDHIRLDPVELGPRGRLELSLSYVLGEAGVVPGELEAPTARGPLTGLEVVSGPSVDDQRVRVDLEGRVAASGSLRIRWTLTEGELGHEAAWDLPVVVRPGADDQLRLALSTGSR